LRLNIHSVGGANRQQACGEADSEIADVQGAIPSCADLRLY
jgi:hypothetical protein